MKHWRGMIPVLSLLCAFFVSFAVLSAPVSAQVVINEIMWDELEYIELRNTGASARDISGWTVEVGGTVEITIDGGASIPAGGFYLIVDNATTVTTAYNEIDAMTLNQGGELVVLKDTQGIAIDTANQAGAWFAGVAGDEGVAMSRADTPGDGTIASNWANDLGGIGGRYGSPGVRNIFTVDSAAAKPGDVVINEIMWHDTEYIELRNTTSDTVKIGDWTIKASGNVEAIIDGGAVIKPGGFYLVGDAGAVSFGMDDTDAINLNQTGETVQLFHANGIAIDTANDGGAWFAGQSTGNGIAMSRKTPPKQGTNPANWADDQGNIGGRNGSPGAANDFGPGSQPVPPVVDTGAGWEPVSNALFVKYGSSAHGDVALSLDSTGARTWVLRQSSSGTAVLWANVRGVHYHDTSLNTSWTVVDFSDRGYVTGARREYDIILDRSLRFAVLMLGKTVETEEEFVSGEWEHILIGPTGETLWYHVTRYPPNPTYKIGEIEPSSLGELLVEVTADITSRGRLQIWRVDGTIVATLPGWISEFRWSDDGQYIYYSWISTGGASVESGVFDRFGNQLE